MKVLLHILNLEDDAHDAELNQNMVSAHWPACDLQRVDNRADFVAALDKGGIDVILSDFTMPGFNGLEALELARERCPDVPFLFVSGTIGEDIAIEALKHGASDYVLKHRLARLIPAMDRAFREAAERAEYERAGEAMRQSEHKYRELFECLGDAALLVVEKTGKIIDTNHRAETVLGCSRTEILGRKETRFLMLDKTTTPVAATGQNMPNTTASECELVRANGATIPVELRSTRLALYGTPLVLRLAHDFGDRCEPHARDTTERKQTRGSLRTLSDEMDDLKTALDEHAIVAITDPQGKITFVNDKFCAISKYTRDELLGQDHRIINSGFHPKEFIRDLWTTIARGKIWKGEIKNRAKDGSYYWVDSTIVPFLNEQGKPWQYVVIRTDITECKLAEERIQGLNTELEQRVAERTAQIQAANQELEAFSHSVSHDLRAPLRHVMGFVELLQKDAGPTLPENSRRYLTTISQAAKRMGDLIDDLLAFSRVGRSTLQKTDVDLNQLVHEILAEFQAETNQRKIAWHIQPLPSVRADRALLRLALVNLISNAVKFTSARTEAEIEIGSLANGGNEVVIFIRDNGAGFDPRYADKLFGVFQRLHSERDFAGTGIGLANVQRIIQRHGGRTWAEGVVDGGATFYFSLPQLNGDDHAI